MLNLATVRTPGVYIDEIPKFPPSIAPVETAIPAFIGYTERDTVNGVSNNLKPILVTSLVEYEEKFGGAAKPVVTNIDIDINNAVKTTKIDANYLLYDSLRMFFSNGGGKCYIVSVGKYKTVANFVDKTELENGLNALELADEPTLINFPDATLLTAGDAGGLYNAALEQCENLKDRFLIADVKIADTSKNKFEPSDISNFRNSISMGNLQYGAAYYPYLKVNIPRFFHFRDFYDKVTKLGVPVNWKAQFINASDAETLAQFDNLVNTVTANNVINGIASSPTFAFLSGKTFEDYYAIQKIAFETAYLTAQNAGFASITSLSTTFINVLKLPIELTKSYFDELAKTGSAINNPVKIFLINNILTVDFIKDFIKPLGIISVITADKTFINPQVFKSDLGYPIAAIVSPPAGTDPNEWKSEYDPFNSSIASATAADASTWGLIQLSPANTDADNETTANNFRKMIEQIDKVFSGLINGIRVLLSDSRFREQNLELDIFKRIPVLNGVYNYIKKENYLLPPSGAIAGVYARVDTKRGVWKAPANESLLNVITPSVSMTHEEQGGLNIDPTTGKSINLVRYFTGKGTLVWGGRTLAGNDNEWRYVNVRRLFNMVEESCKKATETFVFEPNDANTWVKVQAMIENFLTTLWRQGAFFGATPDKAFYVLVGLGKTMTPLDILEGRMIVEIGIAANRPAEFIILRFSHKLPEL